MASYDQKLVAGRIRLWQEESGLKGREVAAVAGIEDGYYSEVRRGVKPGTVDVLARIVQVFGRTLEELFEGTQKGSKGAPLVIGDLVREIEANPESLGYLIEVIQSGVLSTPEFRQALRSLVAVALQKFDE